MADGMATKPLLVLAHKLLGQGTALLAGAGIFTAIDFNHTITLGSVLIVVVIAGLAGFFTVRSKIAEVWRIEAEGERKVRERLEDELVHEKQSRADFDRAQQELRHELKDEIAALKAQLKVMEAKTDLTAALDAIREINERTTESIVQAMTRTSGLSETRDGQTHKLLEEIRDKLPNEPIVVRDITTE